MIGSRRVLALITARGGSKGLPGKNIRPLAGKPMLAWTIEAALAAQAPDRVVLSSDDEDIMAVARAHGCEVPFVRPAALASDTCGSLDVALHALDSLDGGFDTLVLLQPTSPLRLAGDIDQACRVFERSGAPSCASVCAAHPAPQWIFSTGADGRLQPVLDMPGGAVRRQDLPDYWALNGAIYIADVDWLRHEKRFVSPQTVPYVMPKQRSVDIDDLVDFQLAEVLLRQA